MNATERLIPSRALLTLTGNDSRATIQTLERRGLLPPRVPGVGGRAAWVEREVATVIAARVAGATDDEVQEIVRKLVAARPTLCQVASAVAGDAVVRHAV